MISNKRSDFGPTSFHFGYKNNPQFYWGQINERSEQ